MKEVSKVVSSFKESIFATITREAVAHKAVNLGQGFPDFDGPGWLVELARDALLKGDKGINQYAPMPGVPSLRQAISTNYKKFYDLNYDFHSEITVTNGATEAIFSSTLGLLNPGDEVIVFEPFYDSYIASIELAGGKVVPVTLNAPDFKFKVEELEQAFSEKTKLVFLNTPHNPTGKVFGISELNTLATLVKKHDVWVISDEVYEFLTFDDHQHIPFASLPGMKERTVTISSTGKTFGLTGWKIGWTCAPPKLTHAIRMVHQFNTFCVNHPIQLAMGEALTKMDNYLKEFKQTYSKKRDLFLDGLQDTMFEPIVPSGTYFVMCPIPEEGFNDVDYCMKLIKEKNVASIPPSAFYLKSDEGKKYLRFCFAKKDETLKAALENLKS